MSDPRKIALGQLADYDPAWTGLGESDRSSIPIGNGEVCANVWVESDGIHMYASRSDAISELDRTLKLGEFILSFAPNPFADSDVRQHLSLRDGCINVRATHGDRQLVVSVFVDADSHAILFRTTSSHPVEACLESRSWRTQANDLVQVAGNIWGDEDRSLAPDLAALTESADIVTPLPQGVLVYHRNDGSIVPELARIHNVLEMLAELPDLISNRVFGTYSGASQPVRVEGNCVRSAPVRAIDLRVATFSTQSQTVDDIIQSVEMDVWDGAAAQARTFCHWSAFWSKSWIFVSGDTPARGRMTPVVEDAAASNVLPTADPFVGSQITRAYVLTKWMHACGLGGSLPMLYNGALFTTMPGAGRHLSLDAFGVAFTAAPSGRPTLGLNPDERSWTTEHLWQNLRLHYYSVLARGEVDALLPLFTYFHRFWRLNRFRARRHHHAAGQWSTEMTLSCGLQSPAIYGLDRHGLDDIDVTNRWGGSINLSPGLELCKLMMDYWRFTGDDAFLADEIIPYARDLIDFARSRYAAPGRGRLQFGPLNSLETYFDTINPIAVVAGYHRLVSDLHDVPESFRGEIPALDAFEGSLPNLPTEPDGQSLAPATAYTAERQNVESPELYAIFPFDLRGEVSDAMLQQTWDKCRRVSGAFRPATLGEPVGTPSFAGWQYLAPTAVLLGRIAEAIEALTENCSLGNPGFSFPAMWGPIYDAVPDVDHGANILNTLHLLVEECITNPQARSKLPAEWVIDFQVFSPTGDVRTGRVEAGAITFIEGAT